MSPRRFVPKDPVIRALTIVAGLVTIVGSVAAAARVTVRAVSNIETRTHANSTFVRQDIFGTYQQGEAKRFSVDSASRLGREARIDTALAALYRACQREGRCP